MDSHDVVIVGTGHAGAQAAIALRQNGFAGTIAMVGDEPDLPYERPPLSKDYLAGDKAFERLLIRPQTFWDEREITIITSTRVVDVDAVAKTLRTAAGAMIGYGALVWATGGAARTLPLPGFDLAGIHSVRTRADVDAMRRELADVRDVVIVGGGYIGLEAAAVLRKLGKSVCVLEAQSRVLARVAGPELSHFYEAEHRAHGVDVRLNQQISHAAGQDGRVAAVVLADGTALAAQMVIVGIGIVPAVQPLLSAGAQGQNGVDVDAHCATSLADVYAIGDCAAHANMFAGGQTIRLESVQNANDQASTIARALCGAPEPYAAVPWFWSNQYDLKLQTVGLSAGYDQTVLRGNPAARKFSLVYLRGGQVIALDCVNNVRDYVQGKALIAGRAHCNTAMLADPDVALKDLQF